MCCGDDVSAPLLPTVAATSHPFCIQTIAVSACRCVILTGFFFLIARLQVCVHWNGGFCSLHFYQNRPELSN